MNLVLDQIEPAMRIVPGEPMSVEQFWRFSADNPDLRMEREPNGDVIVMTPTTRRSGHRNVELLYALRHWTEQDGRGFGFDSSTGFTLPDGSVRSADAAWVRSERWTPDEEDDYLSVLTPDFVIELLSKTDRLSAAREKMRAWIANGVELGWMIDPKRRVVEIYRAGAAEPEIVAEAASIAGDGPVSGLVMPLERIWR